MSGFGSASRAYRGRSLEFRLAFAFTASAVAVLSTATLILAWRTGRELRRIETEVLRERVRVLLSARAREAAGDAGELGEQLRYLSDVGPLFTGWVRVLDAHGAVVVDTRGRTRDAPSPGLFAPPASPAAARVLRVRSPEGRSYLTLCVEDAPQGPRSARIFEVALDVSGEAALLAADRVRLAWAWLAGSLVAGAMAAWVARRGLAPLRGIAASVSGVTVEGLDRRLNSGDWPAEMDGLVGSLNAMLEGLGVSFQRLSDFSGDLAHELRTPLHALRTRLEVTLARERTPTQYRRALNDALELITHLNRLSDDLLFLALSGRGAEGSAALPLDARGELEKVLGGFREQMRAKRLRLEVRGGATVYADPVLLRRALTNLLSNAVNHSPRGARVALSWRRGARGGAVFGAQNSGPRLPPQEVRRLGVRFFRPSGSAQRRGSGLGLAIVRSIMERHGGTFSVAAPSGGGLKVRLEFPPQRAEGAPSSRP